MIISKNKYTFNLFGVGWTKTATLLPNMPIKYRKDVVPVVSTVVQNVWIRVPSL